LNASGCLDPNLLDLNDLSLSHDTIEAITANPNPNPDPNPNPNPNPDPDPDPNPNPKPNPKPNPNPNPNPIPNPNPSPNPNTVEAITRAGRERMLDGSWGPADGR
jgi:hypothetical protein